MDVLLRLQELGLELPKVPPIVGIYKPVKQVGNLLYVSGQGPTVDGIPVITGKIGAERTIAEGQEAARICTLNSLSILQDFLGDLNRIKSVVKTLGFVASAPHFNYQPKVIDGASHLLVQIFGEAGQGARSAVGVSELPFNISVEIEFLIEI
ncbi:MAG: RidA family protein [Sphaerochaetaceae bacterium]|jgi:enamine deaminase RidA (YjgF/YER057c/UK114 family)|nr:RidA family protein [Sphaerochaetaceae bacterium]MDD4219757.1 RidA family protein [Sphaerochaetaceae bacterium]MDY0371920.1 RidA family protein [Sphaerochaetaceae bacterium]